LPSTHPLKGRFVKTEKQQVQWMTCRLSVWVGLDARSYLTVML